MKNFILLLSISLSILACKKEDAENGQPGTQSQQTHIQTLLVDSFTSGDPAYQSAFVSGEAAAVTLGPVSNTFRINYIKFLLGGTVVPETKNVVLKIYTDVGNTDPDSLLIDSTLSLISSNNTFQEIDLRNNNITVAGGESIRVSLETGDGLPSVAADTDGTINSSCNWIYTSGAWNTSLQMGVTGDFIIRAVVEEDI